MFKDLGSGDRTDGRASVNAASTRGEAALKDQLIEMVYALGGSIPGAVLTPVSTVELQKVIEEN